MDDVFSLDAFKTDLEHLITSYTKALKKISTGRAHPAIVDGLTIEVSGSQIPLNQLSTIIASESTTLKITPFDNNLNLIYEVIKKDPNLNLNPTDDGRSIYIPIPPMTTERRNMVIKQLQSQKEDFLIGLRQSRHNILKHIKEADLSEDFVAKLTKDVDSMTTETKDKLENLTKTKSDEYFKYLGRE